MRILIAFALLAVPLGLPESWAFLRTVTTGFALSLSIKLAYLRDGRIHPSMRAPAGRLALWLLVPTASMVPTGAVERRAVRRLGARRLGRAAIKVSVLIALVLAKPLVASLGPVHTLLVAFQIYFMISGVADVISGLLGLFAVLADDAFHAPFAAASPGEFWGRRWNTFVSQFLSRYVFRPWAKRRRPLMGILAAFALSGLAHEYFVVATVGWAAFQPGYMTSFFLLHGLAVMMPIAFPMAARGLDGLPRGIKVALHLGWMTATAPLFIGPLTPLIDRFDETLIGLLAALPRF